MPLHPIYKLIDHCTQNQTQTVLNTWGGKNKVYCQNVGLSWTRCLNTWLQLSGYTEPNIAQKALSEKKNTDKLNIFNFNPKIS